MERGYLDQTFSTRDAAGGQINTRKAASEMNGPELTKPQQELSRIEQAINSARVGWTLCFIGEDQSKKLATLTQHLRGRASSTGDGKEITSGFSYWGIGPTLAWTHACNDPFYLVMKESIESFPERWTQILPSLDRQNYHYVSLGVGTGHKDRDVLRDLYKIHPDLFYFPVDMSPEMLRVGVQESTKGASLERRKVLPIQLDFSSQRNVEECRGILDRIVEDDPILFSLLGNTLANFEKDGTLLKILTKLLRPQDRLLLEVAYTETLEDEAVQEAADEYSRSRPFTEFVTSSLLQNTDLRLNLDDVSFIGAVEQDRAIRIKALYHNNSNETRKISLPDRTHVDFPPQDTIRLYLTRKYTRKGLDALLKEGGLSLLSRERSVFDPSRSRFDFGVELMLLTSALSTPAQPRQSAFISYGAPDQEFANRLNEALNKKGVRTFFFLMDGVPGEKAYQWMQKGVNEFDRTILICSQRSLERPAVLYELDSVLSRESREGGSKRLLPLTLDRHVFETWNPQSSHLKTAVLDRMVCDFTEAEQSDEKFNAALDVLLSALVPPKK
ncbi:L-histidine N(alpha)-methyltransferase [Dictyobacter kobayashii]|uniref:TIR domain-containing protein n=1 Tax=Dictyobacter kobayashii TaxID=2014872 RepID=A0A402ARK2_9CHLR|nr:L-histidine N(alpha)-methyltransferase [Dictyobacter kobayashii]GCE21731.1 hypothetical protein KDK_55310 [Dictyobacter kobayashii]